jgi:ABC-2 type transport system ATP-binding protein
MDEALHFHRLALMHDGRMIATGTPDELANQFVQQLLEISGPEVHSAWRLLGDASLEGVDTHRFGDRVHVTYDDKNQEDAIRRIMERLNVRVDPTRPTIEDTFVSLVTALDRGGA